MTGRRSLACNAGVHDECVITWCACECHNAPDTDDDRSANPMSYHDQIQLLDPFTGREVGIDQEMVPLIEALWALGIQTVDCCQGPPVSDLASICFAEPKRRRLHRRPVPSGAEQLHRLLPPAVIRPGWEFQFRHCDDCPWSYLMLPAEDIAVLVQALIDITKPAGTPAGLTPIDHRPGQAGAAERRTR